MPVHYSLAAQTYVWVQKFAEAHLDFNENLERIFEDAAFAGIPSLEFSIGQFGADEELAKLSSLATQYGVSTPLFYAGGDFHEPERAEVAVEKALSDACRAKEVGVLGITTNPSPKPGGANKTSAELKTQAEALNRLGEGLQKIGVQLYYHTHDPEIRHNAREFRTTCDLTDPQLVKLCYDVHWVYRGGADPLAVLREYADRVGALHLRNSVDTIWDEYFREGDIDYSQVHEILSEASLNGWLILELALEAGTPATRTLAENLRLSMESMRRIFEIDE
ncbi:MAG: sugar phosphate isomerase/epimerase [Armatimonadetes bacterium]|nr:sugar phosphate isomerase/epimerase [Armatimonadota bacterium]